MFTKEDVIEDPCTDEAGQIMKSMLAIPTWTKAKHILSAELDELLESKKYIYFRGHSKDYSVSCVGTSCLYQIPLNRRGHLSVFRGKLIRLVCVSTGQFDRGYMAAVYP